MRPVRFATLVTIAALTAGCGTQGVPTVGTIASCGPGLDPTACRGIAQAALTAYQGPALSADNIDVDVLASCDLSDVTEMSADAARSATACYNVTALGGNSGGRRVSEGAYQGGKLVN